MSTRQTEPEESTEPAKKRQKLKTVNGKMEGKINQKCQIIQDQIIPMAVKHLSSFEDIKTCFLISKAVRNGIFAEASVMQRNKFVLNGVTKEEAVRFLFKRGYAVRFLDIKADWKFGKSMKYFLHKLDKLVELKIEGSDYDGDEDELLDCGLDLDLNGLKAANLSNLKVLKINHVCDLKDFMENSRNLTNLTELTAKFSDDDDHDILTTFLCQQLELLELNFEDSNDDFEFPNRDIKNLIEFKLQKLRLSLSKIHNDNFISFLSTQASNLQVLELEVDDTFAFNFPPRDISKEVNLCLKVLKFSHSVVHNENFLKFLRTQALCLQELELNLITFSEIFVMIFSNFKVLKKLTIDEVGSDVMLEGPFLENLTLDSLRYFHDKNQNGTIVKKTLEYFPNLETLKCCDTMQAIGTAEKLTTLDVSVVYWPRIRNLKMPNLKNLFIKKIDRCDDESYWTHFCDNFLNIENITVEKISHEDQDVLRFVKTLKRFKKLKTFKLRHGNAIDFDYKLDENEKVKVGFKFFKILMDKDERTVKISSYIVLNCLKELKLLRKIFKDFQFFEFCFEELRIEKL